MIDHIISADSHVTEPPNCYLDRIDARFRSRAPHVEYDPKQGDVFLVEGRQPIPMWLVSSAGKPPEELRPQGIRFQNLHQGGWNPHARIKDQEHDGISAEIIYPSVGMEICNILDLDLKQACMEAYNRWLAEFCDPYPNRLIGVGQCAIKTTKSGIEELKSIKSLGFRGVMLPGVPGQEDYNHGMYKELFDAIVDLDLVPSFHVRSSNEASRQASRGSKINFFMSVIRGNQDLISMFVFDGIFMRHPKLKIVSVEADGGWIPHYMYRMDHAYDRHRRWMQQGRDHLNRRPSEYFREHIYFTFQDDYTAFQFKDHMNIERMMWANDFPHADSTWPRSQELLKEQLSHMNKHEKELVLRDNVANLYKINTKSLDFSLRK